jgi:uncharacterized protein
MNSGIAESMIGKGTLTILVLAGSHAYGLETEESDIDYRGVFQEDPRIFLGIKEPRETLEHKEPDIVLHELRKFTRLALKGNPNVLETLWSDGYTTNVGRDLINIRKSFLHKGSLQPYLGYAKSQLWRLDHNRRPKNQGTEDADPKFSCHLLRILLAGIHLAKTGEAMVNVGLNNLSLLQLARSGNLSLGHVKELAHIYMTELEQLIPNSILPDKPDIDTIENFVRSVRLKGMKI